MKPISRKKIIIFTAVIVIFSYVLFDRNRKVSVNLPNHQTLYLSKKEKKYLEKFFRYVIQRDDFGYTLIGSKPISFTCFVPPLSFQSLNIFYMSILWSNIEIYIGWKTWLKYHRLLDKSRYYLWAEENYAFPGSMCIILANKPLVKDIVEKYFSDFNQVLQTNKISGDALFKQAEEKPLFSEVLQGHEGLIGTLLGYGRDNSWRFQNNDQSLTDNEKQNKYNYACLKPSLFSNKDIESFLLFPSFLADPHTEETVQLYASYERTRQLIIDYYSKRDFLQATLELLCGSPSIL